MTAATKKNKYECNGGTPGNIPRFRDFKRLTMGIAASADSRGQFHTGLALLVSRHLMDEAYLLIGLWYGIGPTDELGDIWTANLMEHGFVTKERSERRFRLWKERNGFFEREPWHSGNCHRQPDSYPPFGFGICFSERHRHSCQTNGKTYFCGGGSCGFSRSWNRLY